MPVITNAPIGVDLINGSEGPRSGFNPLVIKVTQTLFYQVLVSYSGSPVVGTLHVYKTTDGGQTWVEKDSANSPDQNNQCGFYNVFYDAANSSVDVLYRTGTFNTLGGSIIICRFSITTDTWGAPGTAFDITTIPDNANEGKYCFFRKPSSGNWVVISASLSFFPSVFRLFYLTYNGATWAGPTNLTSNNADGSDVWGGVLAPDGTYHFLADNGSFGILYYQLSPTFTLSTKISLSPPNMHVNAGFGGDSRPSIVLFGADSVAVSFTTTAGDVRTFIGTPLAAPVFTTYIIYTNVGSEETLFGTLVVDNSGQLNTFFIVIDSVDVPNEFYAAQSTFNGVSWSVPIVFYDEVTNPPVVGVQEAFHKFDVFQLANNQWVATTAMGADGENNNVGYVLLSSTPTTLQLVKTVTPGGSKVATDWTLSATGPDTISGAGGVGPVAVTPGTYQLSETAVSGYQARSWVCVGGTQAGNQITLAEGDSVVCSIINDPIPLPLLPTGSGGRGFIHAKTNFFDGCLGREFLLYKTIDRELLKCGVKPKCFCIDERDWGGNFSEHEEVPMGPPEGAIAFNPTGQISLPTAASGDNVIFTFRVPWGYDGVILGQFQGYYGEVLNPPVPGTFIEGSGDIVWRLSIAGRFGRDCGNTLVSLGSIRNMSPIAGGLQIRSENVIQYVVAAPNTSGTLTPGLGNIVAAIHGWMWPRK